ESDRARAHASPRHQVRESHRHRAHAGALGSCARAEAPAGEDRLNAIGPKPRAMHRRYSVEGAPVFGEANLLGATRQLTVNTPGSGFCGPGHASCGVSCKELDMATQMANRRESDRVPMGV